MAYKYKLVKELGPQDFEKAAGTVGLDTMDAVSKGQLNYQDYDELEKILGQAGLEQSKIEQILDLWSQRSEYANVNEKEEGYYKDPETGEIKQGSLQTSLNARMKSMFGEPNPNKVKNTFKSPEEQGKEKLTQEVLRRLKNR